VQIAEVGAAIVAGALLVNATLADPKLWVLYVCSALLAAFTAVRRPPLDALIPRLVERDELKAASALQFSFHNMATLAGPALAGLLIAGAGLTVTYGVDIASFAASLVVLTAMRTPPPPPEAEPPSWRTIKEGVRYATSRQDLVGTYLVDMNAMFFGMPMALFPAIAKGYGGAEVLGLRLRGAVGGLDRRHADERVDGARAPPRPRSSTAPRSGARRSSPSASPTRCGWPSPASSWPARWTRSAASSARRCGTRRSPTTCAGGWPASR
jgi:hypothetical protein